MPYAHAKCKALLSTENAIPDIQSADLIFEFVGVDDRLVQHRCTARQFLSSPWYTVTRQPRSVQQEDNTRISDSDMRLLNNLIFPMPPPEDATSNNPVTKVGILGLVSRHSAWNAQWNPVMQTFFWTAFVRFNFTPWSGRPTSPGDREPFIELSPQRVIGEDASQVWDGEWFRINENGKSGYHMVHHEHKKEFAM